MRYLKFVFSLFISCCSIVAAADDYSIYGENIKVDNGTSTAVVNIYMTNVETISALQFDITLPEGIDVFYGKNNDGDMAYLISKGERAKSSQSSSYKKIGERSYRVMVTSTTNATFKETEANRTKPVAMITLDLSNATYDQINMINICEIVLSHYDTETYATRPYYPQKSQFSVTVGNPFIKGDVNGDTKMDILDVSALINYLNGSTPSNFVEVAANVDNEGGIDLNDVTALINLILGKSQ